MCVCVCVCVCVLGWGQEGKRALIIFMLKTADNT